jgi:hypothetical protein
VSRKREKGPGLPYLRGAAFPGHLSAVTVQKVLAKPAISAQRSEDRRQVKNVVKGNMWQMIRPRHSHLERRTDKSDTLTKAPQFRLRRH